MSALRYVITIPGDVTPAKGQTQAEAETQTGLLLLPAIEASVRRSLYMRSATVEYAPGGTELAAVLVALSAGLRDDDEPLILSDEELATLAVNACDELRRRMPRYAFEQGDLDLGEPGAEDRMETAEDACRAAEAMREAWTKGV